MNDERFGAVARRERLKIPAAVSDGASNEAPAPKIRQARSLSHGPSRILGISAFYHDSAAALLREGEIVAAAQEERFSRRKNDERFPQQAIEFCLRQAGIKASDLDAVVFYDKPVTKFVRSIETWLTVAPRGYRSFVRVLPEWFGGRLNLDGTIREEIPGLEPKCEVLFAQHHQSHAASAFYPSPFADAAILTVDGVGEYATTTIAHGSGSKIDLLEELKFPHSLGLLYSAFTAYCGFHVNSGEYKLMGLAPYGQPKYAAAIRDHLLDLKPDGSFKLNLDYFDFLGGQSMTNEKFHTLFGGPPRNPADPLDQRHMDVARSIQAVTEEILLRLARHAREITGQRNLCLAGGVALNCVANGIILREKIFDRIWIQPAAGDAGAALGAALAVWYNPPDGPPRERQLVAGDSMQGALLGPSYTDQEIETVLKTKGAVYHRLRPENLITRTAELLAEEKVVGWVQGRMEFGPRALGSRSILGDARSPRMQSVMNLKIKFRESFRPFAPVVPLERVSNYFELEGASPYMLIVAPVRESLRSPPPTGASGLNLLRHPLSTIPAVTHVDYSARVQTVDGRANPQLHELLLAYERMTGSAVLVNTSFNIRGEPIVCSPEDGYRCFLKTEMDALVMGHFLLIRSEQLQKSVEGAGRVLVEELEKAAPAPSSHGPKLKESPREWQKFAVVWAVAVSLLLYNFKRDARIGVTPYWAIEGLVIVLLILALVCPRLARLPYRWIMTATHYIGRPVSKVMLSVFFLVAMTPFGLLMRALGKTPLDLKIEPGAATYWSRPAPLRGFRRPS